MLKAPPSGRVGKGLPQSGLEVLAVTQPEPAFQGWVSVWPPPEGEGTPVTH